MACSMKVYLAGVLSLSILALAPGCPAGPIDDDDGAADDGTAGGSMSADDADSAGGSATSTSGGSASGSGGAAEGSCAEEEAAIDGGDGDCVMSIGGSRDGSSCGAGRLCDGQPSQSIDCDATTCTCTEDDVEVATCRVDDPCASSEVAAIDLAGSCCGFRW